MKIKMGCVGPFLGLLFTVVSCGNSPLLHHEQEGAKDRSHAAVASAPQDPACPLSFPQSGLCASIEWKQTLNVGRSCDFVLRFWDAKTGSPQGPFIDPDLKIGVEPRMNSMGHGTSPVDIWAFSPGEYLITRVFFTMVGPWDVEVLLKRGDDVVEKAVLAVRL